LLPAECPNGEDNKHCSQALGQELCNCFKISLCRSVIECKAGATVRSDLSNLSYLLERNAIKLKHGALKLIC